MKNEIGVNKLGLVVGIVFALMHLTWVLTLAIFGQPAKNFIANIHFIEALNILPVTFGMAIGGITLAFVSGYITGVVFAWVWNWVK